VNATIRRAATQDGAALARLRWMWAAEKGVPELSRPEFEQIFHAWMHAARDTHLPFLAEAGVEPVGMAWLAIVERVPTPAMPRRAGGDLQSVYVAPQLRGRGIGSLLINSVVRVAADRGLLYLTVLPDRRAAALYRRLGFTDAGDCLIQSLPSATTGSVER
jgi:GNAT superfamily N-acetyltransferase